ncbi:hypothetical protein M422DRAFT_272401 [Sphaerobolus stellatus SS14]|uniref:Uncharacterized protein n=1 Tax=Sphaerobolus stellatus (strain SS14) TaxID=990650 RepID=A0A0C9TXJ5_SPHS4|nr:hypothetical protein M422DRAFT_272401 [Sphaerobolus stellatus SS14]
MSSSPGVPTKQIPPSYDYDKPSSSTPTAQAPIDVHNKTYVKLLQPQTDILQDDNEYTTYERFPLKHIPHIHFGYLESGVNVWVAWPRMTHRQVDSPYYANQVPMLVQDQWFS